MSGAPMAPWKFECPWCNYALTVFGRGQRGNDEGAGYEAAVRMQEHVERGHGRSWPEFLAETAPRRVHRKTAQEAHDNWVTLGNPVPPRGGSHD